MFSVQGSVFSVQCSVFRVQGSGCTIHPRHVRCQACASGLRAAGEEMSCHAIRVRGWHGMQADPTQGASQTASDANRKRAAGSCCRDQRVPQESQRGGGRRWVPASFFFMRLRSSSCVMGRASSSSSPSSCTVPAASDRLQGYLAHKKPPTRRTMPRRLWRS